MLFSFRAEALVDKCVYSCRPISCSEKSVGFVDHTMEEAKLCFIHKNPCTPMLEGLKASLMKMGNMEDIVF